MKLLIFNFSSKEKIGGNENHLINLSNGLIHRGAEIKLFTNNKILFKKFQKRNWPVKYGWFGWQPLKKIKILTFLLIAPFVAIKTFIILVKNRFSNKDKIILCSYLSEKLIVTPLAKLLGYKVFWDEHTTIDRWLTHNPYKIFYKLYSRWAILIAGSYFIKKQLSEKLKIKSPIKVIYSGITLDTPGLQEDIWNSLVDKNYPIDRKDQFVLGTISKLEKIKNLEYLLQAIKIARQFVKNIQLIIIGEGPERNNLIWLAKQLQIDDIVRFIGYKIEPVLWLKSFDIYISPPVEKESFGFTILKAMAYKKPVIVPRIDHLEELVEQKQTGILIEPKNPEMLSQLIINFYNHPEWIEQMGRNARKKVEDEFSLDTMINRYFEILK